MSVTVHLRSTHVCEAIMVARCPCLNGRCRETIAESGSSCMRAGSDRNIDEDSRLQVQRALIQVLLRMTALSW